MSGYLDFAKVYDILTDDVCYKERAEFFDKLLLEHGNKKRGSLLDLACGTGSLSEEMLKLGWSVLSCDGSIDMLMIANNKKIEKNLDITYIHQNMEELELYEPVDAVVCALDSLNHITDEKKLETALKRVYKFLKDGGVFVFDVNTVYKHENILENNTFVYDYEDVYLVWKNTLKPQNIVRIELDMFVKENEAYYKTQESFCERAYSCEEMSNLLEKAGFETIAVYSGDNMKKYKPSNLCSEKIKDQRLIYVVKKGKDYV